MCGSYAGSRGEATDETTEPTTNSAPDTINLGEVTVAEFAAIFSALDFVDAFSPNAITDGLLERLSVVGRQHDGEFGREAMAAKAQEQADDALVPDPTLAPELVGV